MGRSPIDMMIDKACGFDPSKPLPKRPMVTLKCPQCGKTMEAAKEKTDPKRTKTVLLNCQDCDEGDFYTPSYWDENGKEINPVTGRPFKESRT